MSRVKGSLFLISTETPTKPALSRPPVWGQWTQQSSSPGLQPQPLCLAAADPWTCYLTFLHLSFLFYKMGTCHPVRIHERILLTAWHVVFLAHSPRALFLSPVPRVSLVSLTFTPAEASATSSAQPRFPVLLVSGPWAHDVGDMIPLLWSP